MNQKYAEVWWEIEDLKEYDLSEEKKEAIMTLLEEDIQDKMIQAGWDVIYNHMYYNNYKRRKTEDND